MYGSLHIRASTQELLWKNSKTKPLYSSLCMGGSIQQILYKSYCVEASCTTFIQELLRRTLHKGIIISMPGSGSLYMRASIKALRSFCIWKTACRSLHIRASIQETLYWSLHSRSLYKGTFVEETSYRSLFKYIYIYIYIYLFNIYIYIYTYRYTSLMANGCVVYGILLIAN